MVSRKAVLAGVLMLAGMSIITACGSSSQPADDQSSPAASVDVRATEAASPSGETGHASAAEARARSKPPEVVEAENAVKLIINLNGRLCAEITNVQPVSESVFHVTCIKNIGGKRTIDYLVDSSDNSVERI